MCDYCEQRKPLDLKNQYTDTNIREIFLEDGKLMIRQDRWSVDLDTHDLIVSQSTQYAELDANFCLHCGRNLKEVLIPKKAETTATVKLEPKKKKTVEETKLRQRRRIEWEYDQ